MRQKLFNYTAIRDKSVTLSNTLFPHTLKRCRACSKPVRVWLKIHVGITFGEHSSHTHTVVTGLYRELMQRTFRRLRPRRRSQAILLALTPDFHAETHTTVRSVQANTSSCGIKTWVGCFTDNSLFSTSQSQRI